MLGARSEGRGWMGKAPLASELQGILIAHVRDGVMGFECRKHLNFPPILSPYPRHPWARLRGEETVEIAPNP